MRIKPFSSFKTVVQSIFFFGVILDTYCVYLFWSNINDDQQIHQMLASNGLTIAENELGLILETFQNALGLLLVVFLLWDYVAYYYFLKYREWARKYVLSIAAFYLLSCLWEFSFLQGIYGLATFYYIWGTRKEFFHRKNSSLP